MRSPDLEAAFPKLMLAGYEITSPRDDSYNCIAWAAGDASRWWWPDPSGSSYWPEIRREETLAAFIQVFAGIGYQACISRELEAGVEKVAIFVDSGLAPTHMARQLPSGEWTSKCGRAEDLTHPLEALEGEVYGTVAQIMRRPVPAEQLPEE